MEIRVVVTGGTIAKQYDEISGELHFDEKHFEKIVKQGRCEANLRVEHVMMKDSLEMTDKDRAIIYDAVNNAKESAVMIIHGTDTMVHTAQALSSIKEKTIVLVGAMIPYAFKQSDALFNVGCAIGAVSALDAGIYVVMNGRVFEWNQVEKDRIKGVFRTLH